MKGWRKSLRSLFYPLPSLNLLAHHAEKVCASVDELIRVGRIYVRGVAPEEVRAGSQRVSQLEHEADLLKAQLRARLPRSDSLLPVARSDLLELLWQQDEIADVAQDAANLLPLMSLALPPTQVSHWEDLLACLEEGVTLYRRMIQTFQGLLEQGFRRQEVEQVLRLIQEINLLEHRGDEVGYELIAEVYGQPELDAFAKYHLIQVFLKMGDVLDHMENAAGRIRLMLAR